MNPSCHSAHPAAMPACFRLPLVWVGGKQRFVKHLLPLIPPHTCYCEPFAGGAALFFRKEPAPVEVLNDINGELINFYRQLQKDIRPFWDAHTLAIPSRGGFKATKGRAALAEFEAAWNFYYRNRLSFCGKSETYAVEPLEKRGTQAHTFATMPPHLLAAHMRLQRASLECLPFQECVARYDRPGTLFFLNPPYIGVERYYGSRNFREADLERLAEILAGIAGKFILAIGDCQRCRELFSGFNLAGEYGANYSLNQGKRNLKRELIYTGGGSWEAR